MKDEGIVMNKYEILEEKLKNRSKILGTTLSLVNSPLMVEKMNLENTTLC